MTPEQLLDFVNSSYRKAKYEKEKKTMFELLTSSQEIVEVRKYIKDLKCVAHLKPEPGDEQPMNVFKHSAGSSLFESSEGNVRPYRYFYMIIFLFTPKLALDSQGRSATIKTLDALLKEYARQRNHSEDIAFDLPTLRSLVESSKFTGPNFKTIMEDPQPKLCALRFLPANPSQINNHSI